MEGYLLIITVLYGMTIGCQGQVDVNLGNDGQTNSEHLIKPEMLVSSQADTLEPLRGHNVESTTDYTVKSTTGFTVESTTGFTVKSTTGFTVKSTTGHTVESTTDYTVESTTAFTVVSTTGFTVESTTGFAVESTTDHTVESTTGETVKTPEKRYPQLSDLYSRSISLGTSPDQNGASAFYVALSRAASIGASETLKFDKVITNNGNVYDVTTGQFTAPTSGTYIFHLSLACEEGSYIEVSIVEIDIGDEVLKPMFNTICDRRQNSGFHQNGGSAILRLVQGDSVMVKMLWPNYEKQKVAGNGFTTFSGYMLSS